MKHLILLILALLCICTMAAQDSYFTPSSKNKTKIEEEASKNIDNFFNTSEWDKDYAEPFFFLKHKISRREQGTETRRKLVTNITTNLGIIYNMFDVRVTTLVIQAAEHYKSINSPTTQNIFYLKAITCHIVLG